jgi:ribosomal protein S18 acetylase RimI-like enzyme
MTEIEYNEYLNDEQSFDLIRPLLGKLLEYTGNRSPHFSDYFLHRSLEGWKKQYIINTSNSGALRIDLAKDVETGEIIGFCTSIVSEDNKGEINSIYIEPNYQRQGIGGTLMSRALEWMDSLSVKTKTLGVAVGNEEVFKFYSHYNFYPKSIHLEQK